MHVACGVLSQHHMARTSTIPVLVVINGQPPANFCIMSAPAVRVLKPDYSGMARLLVSDFYM